ncbi:energy transducer TonB [Ekhidna sp. MALMAid0563]|uniref:energy transducer TonB n=1 Tax=Ekhidna sp. MALMAid0563 TaxID=3143937 RepID=UPI0032DEFDF3
MSNDKKHSEQFEWYLKGQMSPEEAHAFEREILDDPFAQEALEGFENQGVNSLNDLKHLKSRIQGDKKKTWPWMRVAAVIALLIVGTFTVYFFTDQIEGEQLAVEEEPIEELTQSSPKPDTVFVKNEIPDEAVSFDEKDNQGKVLEQEETLAEKPSSEVRANELLALSDDAEEADQLESKGENIQLAEVEAMEEIVVESTADEMTVMEEVAVPAQAFSAKKKVAKEAEANMAIARSAARSEGAFETNNQMDVPPKPMIGDSLYQQYLKQELIYPDAAQENEIEGEVILKLTISASGEIIDIKIEKSLGYGCDEEAIRLIEEGPGWVPGNKDGSTVESTITVHVNFRLD